MSKGADTKAQVLDEALRLASITGLDGVSIGLLADKAGLSKSGLFAHFSSKENLQLEILGEVQRRFVELVVSPAFKHKRGEPRVRALWANSIAWPKHDFQPGGCIFMAATSELDDQPGPVRDALVGSQKDWMEAIAQAARIAVSEGHFRKDLDEHQFAQEFESMIHGYHYFSRLLKDPKAEARANAAFERLVKDARA